MAAVVLLAAVGCARLRARSSGVRDVAITNVRGHVEFVARQRTNDRVPLDGSGSEEFEETIFEQNLSLETSGYVYHPNLLEFSLAGLFGIQRADFAENIRGVPQSNGDQADIIEFDVSTTLLQKKPYPLHLFARRSRSIQPRPFASSVETLSTSYGAVWQYVHETFPTSLSLSKSVVDIDPYVKANDFPGRREDLELRLESAWILNERSKLTLVYDSQSIQEEPFGFDFETDNLTLEHRLKFGEQDRNQLISTLRYLLQGGNFDLKWLRWMEALTMRHSDTLRGQYLLELADRRQAGVVGGDDINEQYEILSASVEHQLFESLVTTLSADYQNQKFDSGLDIERMSVDLGFDYKKKNRWGVLRADFRVGRNDDARNGAGLVGEVIDRAVVFRDPQPVTLREDAVTTSTISLMRADRTETFQRDRDFRVRDLGVRVELERIPTGRIPEGESVLVSYRYDIGGDYDLDTQLKYFGVRQDFKSGLSPYFRWAQQDQTLTPAGSTSLTPEDFTENVAGLEFRHRRFRFLAELQDRDSTVSTYRATRVTANYTRAMGRGKNLSLSANWSDYRYTTPEVRNTRLLRLETRYTQAISDRAKFESAIAYRNEKDNVSGGDKGIDMNFSLDWRVRRTSVRVTYRLGMFSDAYSDQDTQALFVQVRRRF